MNRILVKPGVKFAIIAPAGFRILEALKAAAAQLDVELTITSACDGLHAGAGDPHAQGEAYDVRSHDFDTDRKWAILRAVMIHLQRGALDAPIEGSGGLFTAHFFGWIEHPGEFDEHFHFQRRKGTTYTIADWLAS